MDILELLGNITLTTGLDIITIILIVGAVEIIKRIFKPKRFVIFIILLSAGILTSIFYAVFNGVNKDLIRVILGYPVASIGLYMVFDKYLKERFEKWLRGKNGNIERSD